MFGKGALALAIAFSGVLIAAAIVATHTGLFDHPPAALLGPARKAADPYAELRTAVANELVDPESADVKNVRRTDSGYCGEVNGRTRTGGYVGFQQFFASPKADGGWIITFAPPLVDVMCKAAG
jgi:hypothetical protein